MLAESQKPNDHRHVKAFYSASKLIWGEFVLIGNVDIQIARDWGRRLLDMVHLLENFSLIDWIEQSIVVYLVEASDEEP